MALTPDQLAEVRTEIGDEEPPLDADLDEIHDRRLGLVGVVREVWTKRLATLINPNNPATFAVSGEYSQSTVGNIQAIQKRLVDLAGLPDDSDEIPPGGIMLAFRVFPLQRLGQDR